ncbi:MAG: T9SS type A sorting domain-containing protein [Bacteroidota bacterium]
MNKRLLTFAFIALAGLNYLSAQSTSNWPYCSAGFDDAQGFPVADAVNSVSLGTLTNTTNAQYAAPHYVLYDNLAIPSLVKGNTYSLSASFNVQGGAGYGVWIDFNQNNTFEASELVMGSTASAWLTIGSNTVMTQNITIPYSALPGNTRMRVRIVEDDNYTATNGAAILPCNVSTSTINVMDWGETEDYIIRITSLVGIDETSETNHLKVYPTLATTTLTLSEPLPDNSTYIIRNLAGQELLTGRINNTNQQINVATLAEGAYFLQVVNQGGSLGEQKFIKSKE